MISLHFERDVTVTSTEHASFLGSAAGQSTFVLHGTSETKVFTFRATGPSAEPDLISCTGPFFTSPSPPPPLPPSPLPSPPHPPQPPPALPPTACTLGPRYSLSPPTASGYSARLDFAYQQPGARVRLHFGSRPISAPVAVYGAELLEQSGSGWTLLLSSGRSQVVIVASGEQRTPAWITCDARVPPSPPPPPYAPAPTAPPTPPLSPPLNPPLPPHPESPCPSGPPPQLPGYKQPPGAPPTPPSPPQPPATPQLAAAPTQLKARVTSCDAVSLSWVPPPRRGSPPVERYEISAVTTTGQASDRVHMQVHGLSASFLASGLRAGTQYSFVVAAKNYVGRGAWSAPVTATTRPATERPHAPSSTLESGNPSTCDSVRLRPVSLRAGCAADDKYLLEVAKAGRQPLEWLEVEAPRGDLLASGLDTTTAYVFRLRARNAKGVSDSGPISKPMLPGGLHDALRKAPRVETTSSSSYNVMWGADAASVPMPCRHTLIWRLEFSRGGDVSKAWHVLLDHTEATHHAPELRCPTGCSFRVSALNLAGWGEPSAPSPLLATRRLHPPSHGAVRLEVVLKSGSGGGNIPPAPSFPKLFEHEVAEALEVSPTRIHCVEVRERVGRPLAIVFDVQPTSHAHLSAPQVDGTTARADGMTLWAEPDEQTLLLAQQLSLQLHTAGSAFRVGTLLSRIDANSGLMQLNSDGSVAYVGAWLPPPASPPSPFDEASRTGRPGLSRFVLIAILVLAMLYAWRRRWGSAKRGYEKVAVQADADAGDCDGDVAPYDANSEFVFNDRGSKKHAGAIVAGTRAHGACEHAMGAVANAATARQPDAALPATVSSPLPKPTPSLPPPPLPSTNASPVVHVSRGFSIFSDIESLPSPPVAARHASRGEIEEPASPKVDEESPPIAAHTVVERDHWHRQVASSDGFEEAEQRAREEKAPRATLTDDEDEAALGQRPMCAYGPDHAVPHNRPLI